MRARLQNAASISRSLFAVRIARMFARHIS